MVNEAEDERVGDDAVERLDDRLGTFALDVVVVVVVVVVVAIALLVRPIVVVAGLVESGRKTNRTHV